MEKVPPDLHAGEIIMRIEPDEDRGIYSSEIRYGMEGESAVKSSGPGEGTSMQLE